MDVSIEQFNPTIAELKELAEEASKLEMPALGDIAAIETIKEFAKRLQKSRTSVTKKGKELREEANKFNKAVLGREKELLEITVPQEDRLKSFLSEIERQEVLESRKAFLPARRAEMDELGASVTDDELLQMDSGRYMEFSNGIKQEKLDKERAQLERDRQKLEDDKRIEDAKKEAAEQATREAEAAHVREIERAATEKKRLEAEQAEAEEKARRNKKYQEWKDLLGEDVKIEREGNTFIAYKEISRVTIE